MEQAIPLAQLRDQLKQQQKTSSSIQDKAIAGALEKVAKEGNAQAQYRLALLYLHGQGVATNPQKCCDWLQKAVAQGEVDAMRLLAWLYANGVGVEQNTEQTRKLYLQAAQTGDAKAQTICGQMYQTGKFDMPKDIKQALHWYQQAANQAYGDAEYALGRLLFEGTLVQQNLEAAFQWLSLALMHESKPAEKTFQELVQQLDAGTLSEYKERMLHKIAAITQEA